MPTWLGFFSSETTPRLQYRFRHDPVPCIRGIRQRNGGGSIRSPRSHRTHRQAASLAEMIRSGLLRHDAGVARGYSVPDSYDDLMRPWRKHTSWKRQRKTQWK